MSKKYLLLAVEHKIKDFDVFISLRKIYLTINDNENACKYYKYALKKQTKFDTINTSFKPLCK